MYNIMIIEDDIIIRQELKIFLEKNGYYVSVIENFTNIIDFVVNCNPHFILLDINLPNYDGFSICREIRKQLSIPIVVVTSRDSDIDELMSINLGADDFITKPYNTHILLARINAIINRVYNDDNAQKISFLELYLDVSKSIATFHNNSIELTKNELKILMLLIKNKDNITSRYDIMNELWQSDEFVDDNTLTVNINRLRKKLDEIGAIDILKTKRGQGYLLCR